MAPRDTVATHDTCNVSDIYAKNRVTRQSSDVKQHPPNYRSSDLFSLNRADDIVEVAEALALNEKREWSSRKPHRLARPLSVNLFKRPAQSESEKLGTQRVRLAIFQQLVLLV